MSYVIVFLVALILTLAAILFAQRQVDEEKLELKQAGPHVHHWKQITEFARQCLDHRCGVVEVKENAPDGMSTYLSLMTTTRARTHPIEEASLYPEMDTSHTNLIEGTGCPDCFRVYPNQFPWCPFCDPRPIPHMIYDEEKHVFIEANEASILRLEQARKERNVQLRSAQNRAQLESNNRASTRADSRN